MNISKELGLKVARRLCNEADVELVLPGDLRRELVLHGLAVTHSVTGHGWDLASARAGVSAALPGLGDAARVASALPEPLGGVIQGLAASTRRPMVMLSPAALVTGEDAIETTVHELGHVGDIRAGGLAWCVAFLALPVARAAGETPCYGASLALRVRLGGWDLQDALVGVRRSLTKYGLDANAMTLAEGLLAQHRATLEAGGDPGGVIAMAVNALVAEGWPEEK